MLPPRTLRAPSSVRGIRQELGIAVPRLVGVCHGPSGSGRDRGILGGDHRLFGRRIPLAFAVQDAHRDEDGADQIAGRGHILHHVGSGIGIGTGDGREPSRGLRTRPLQAPWNSAVIRRPGTHGGNQIPHRLHVGIVNEPDIGVQPHTVHPLRAREGLRAGGADRPHGRGRRLHRGVQHRTRLHRSDIRKDAAVGVSQVHRRSEASQAREEARGGEGA
mmetsp:Transcript_29014/g.69973  ORF Transcript_29014/g.69973 Transcript_29014/m.69973 type:complete len:218 (+) Transcript_29014:1385-2038(+)